MGGIGLDVGDALRKQCVTKLVRRTIGDAGQTAAETAVPERRVYSTTPSLMLTWAASKRCGKNQAPEPATDLR
jgi:hypothetical protein